MTYAAIDTYSIFNQYDYSDKSSINSLCDYLSLPTREIFGGRRVNLFTNDISDPSQRRRVILTIVSIVVFPIGIISMGSFLAKLCTCPHRWEKDWVLIESNEITQTLNSFTRFYEENELTQAVNQINRKPIILANEEISQKYLDIIKREIGAENNWNRLSSYLLKFAKNRRIELIGNAVLFKFDALKEDLESDVTSVQENANNLDRFITSINQLVNRSFTSISYEQKKECYENLLINVFSQNTDDDPAIGLLQFYIKIYFIDIIKDLNKEIKIQRAAAMIGKALYRSFIILNS